MFQALLGLSGNQGLVPDRHARRRKDTVAMRDEYVHDEPLVSVAGVVAVRGADHALLVQIPGIERTREIWIPRSVIAEDSEVVEVCDEGELVVGRWWAERELLEEEYEDA